MVVNHAATGPEGGPESSEEGGVSPASALVEVDDGVSSDAASETPLEAGSPGPVVVSSDAGSARSSAAVTVSPPSRDGVEDSRASVGFCSGEMVSSLGAAPSVSVMGFRGNVGLGAALRRAGSVVWGTRSSAGSAGQRATALVECGV